MRAAGGKEQKGQCKHGALLSQPQEADTVLGRGVAWGSAGTGAGRAVEEGPLSSFSTKPGSASGFIVNS